MTQAKNTVDIINPTYVGMNRGLTQEQADERY